MINLSFDLDDEKVELLTRRHKYPASGTIPRDTGQVVNGQKVMIEKPISKQNYLFNWYAGVMDSDALVQKQAETREAAITAIPQVTVVKQESKLPALTQEEIDAAVAEKL